MRPPPVVRKQQGEGLHRGERPVHPVLGRAPRLRPLGRAQGRDPRVVPVPLRLVLQVEDPPGAVEEVRHADQARREGEGGGGRRGCCRCGGWWWWRRRRRRKRRSARQDAPVGREKGRVPRLFGGPRRRRRRRRRGLREEQEGEVDFGGAHGGRRRGDGRCVLSRGGRERENEREGFLREREREKQRKKIRERKKTVFFFFFLPHQLNDYFSSSDFFLSSACFFISFFLFFLQINAHEGGKKEREVLSSVFLFSLPSATNKQTNKQNEHAQKNDSLCLLSTLLSLERTIRSSDEPSARARKRRSKLSASRKTAVGECTADIKRDPFCSTFKK